MHLFRNLKVAYKMTAIMILVLLGFGLVGIAYMLVLDSNDKSQQRIAQLEHLERNIALTQAGLYQGRALEKEFFTDRNIDIIESFEYQMSLARESLAQLPELLPKSMDARPFTQLGELFRSYHAGFYVAAEAQMAIGIDENSGYQGELRSAAHELEALLDKQGRIDLTASMLKQRRHEQDFILREEDKYVERMAGERGNFEKLLGKSGLGSGIQTRLKKLNAEYHKGFVSYVQGARDRQQSQTALRGIMDRLQPLFESTTQAADASLTRERGQLLAEVAVTTRNFAFGLTAIALMIVLAMYLFGRALTQPIRRLQETVEKVGQGDTQSRTGLNSLDELGNLGRAFDELLDERIAQLEAAEQAAAQAEKENDQLNDSVITLMEAVSTLSERDLTAKVPVAEDVTGPVADAVNLMASETARVLQDIQLVAEQVQEAADTVKAQGEKVTGVASKERKVVENTIAKLEQASQTMNNIAGLAQACNEIAARTSASTETAMHTVSDTANGMNEIRETISETEKRIKRLAERSQEISGIVEIVNNIAERTHVLALNASMQAAAAGEAGRGFAVVADEVQRLAESSRNSTSQIGALVKNIQAETSETMATMNRTITQVVNGSKLAEQAGEHMEQTQKTAAELVAAVGQIAERSEDQAKASKELRARATMIQNSTRETSKELQEQTAQTVNLTEYSTHLLESVRVFKLPAA